MALSGKSDEDRTTTSDSFSTLASVFFYVLLTYTLLLIIPSSYQATLPFLDSAWAYNLNYFFHSKFHFGPDLVFTYGPLGFLNNPQHLGQDIRVAVITHGIFLILIGVQLISIWRGVSRMAALVFCLSLAFAHRMYYDYWDYQVLALSLITVSKLFRKAPGYFDLIILPVLLGVAFLLKFTAFSAIILMILAYALHLAIRRSLSPKLCGWLGLCVLSGPIAYLAYDHSLVNLYLYTRGVLEIANSFTTGMSLDSLPRDWQLASVTCFLLFLSMLIALWQKRIVGGESLLQLVVLWIVFRHGFVRGGTAHAALFFGFSVLIFATLFLGWRTPPIKQHFEASWPELTLLLTFSLATFAALSGFAARYPVLVASNWWPQQAFGDIRMLANHTGLSYVLDHSGDEGFAALTGMAFRGAIEGKLVMVYPNGTPYQTKIPFQLFPVYSLQDYQAGTAYLDKKDAQNLALANPPVDKVLYEFVAIDGRNPFLDSPATSMAFLTNFQLEARAPDALLLTHRASPLPIRVQEIGRERFNRDEWVQIPNRKQLVAVSINLKQTFVGNLVTTLFDQDLVFMELQTDSGGIMQYRIPPRVLSTPGIINYVPQSIDDLEKLWRPEPLSKRITRIRLVGPGLRWARSEGYNFYEVDNAGVTFSN